MTELSIARDRESKITIPSIWSYIISVLVSIVLIIVMTRFFFNLVLERSEIFETQKVANETLKNYSQRLEAISEKFEKEIEATKEEI